MDVGLLLEGPTLRRWQADALSYLLEHPDARVTTVLYNERDADRTALETLRRAIELREWAVVGTLSELLDGPMPETDRVALESVLDRDGVAERSVEPAIVDGWKREIPAGAARAVADEADVVIRFGFGFLVGPMLAEPEYGVLSYHHGDLREYRGQPAGFWEFVHGEDTAGITVQRISETLDAGAVAALKTVRIDDLHTWGAVRRRLYAESEDVLATAVSALREGRVREPETLGALYTLPKGRPVLEFAVREAMGRVRPAGGDGASTRE